MKLRLNGREVVLVEVDGLGLLLGEVRYNRQTETASFVLEKAAFFDLYFPCAVVYDQQRGPVVHPHVLSTLSSSIRIQRSRMSCFVLERDLQSPVLAQYQGLWEAVTVQHSPTPDEGPAPEPDPSRPLGASRVITLPPRKDKT